MPDAGAFGQNSDNHGANHHDPRDQGAHAGWAGAFAALPQETPSADAWQRLQARLPAAALPTRQRRRWPLWLASAASLALVIAIPLRMQSTTTTTAIATIPYPAVSTPAPDPVTTQPLVDAGTDVASTAIVPAPVEYNSTIASTLVPTPATTARVRKPRRGTHMDPSQQPIRTVAQPADTTRIASAETLDAPAAGIDQNPVDSSNALDSLYMQSAQLEGLLSLARDDRVSTGTAAALTDTLSGQIANIDAALAQPDVGAQDRDELWRKRVDILRQLVGIETTQRLYSARGLQNAAALVSID